MKTILILALAASLSACATPRDNGQQGPGGGGRGGEPVRPTVPHN